MENLESKITNPKFSASGFTLMELLVVIAIIAIVSTVGIVGFRGFSDSLITKEAKGIIEDTVKSTELEVLQGDYKSSRISFLKDYLVIESAPNDKTLALALGIVCSDDPYGRNIDFESNGTLTKKDGSGNVLSAKAVTSGTNECILFTDSKEAEWVYQITSGDEVSDVIRFVHFNVNRETPSGITLGGEISKTLSIEAPYAKKTISDGSDSIVLTVSGDGSEEALTIK
jgi:prepilin-type N-terminal cleavage/methylation domain-containing protein